MNSYYPLILCAVLILSVLVGTAWPWLAAKEHRDKALTAVLVVFFLSLALYLAVGSPFKVADLEKQQAAHAEMFIQITALEEKASKTTDETDAVPFAELGAAYIQTEQYGKAAGALKEAVKRSDGQPELILMYGKAQMMAADGQVTEGAKQAFEMAAKLMPNNYEPLFMLALERMQAGDKEGARERMKVLLPKLPEGIPLRKMIEQQMKSE